MHYSLLVYVRQELQDTTDIAEAVDFLMEPYSEHLEVDPYQTGCHDCNFWVNGQYYPIEHDCGYCNGTGTVTVRSNPQGKWDYYTILAHDDVRYDFWRHSDEQFRLDRLSGAKPTYAFLAPETGLVERERVETDNQGYCELVDYQNYNEIHKSIYEFATTHGYKPVLIDYHC